MLSADYWTNKEVMQQAVDFGAVLAGSGLGGEEFRNKDTATLIVLLAMKYGCDPITLIQAAYHDVDGKLAFNSHGIKQILYGYFGENVAIEFSYKGDWEKIKGKAVVDRSRIPWVTVRGWTDNEERDLSVTATVTVNEQVYELEVTLLSISEEYRLANANWANNPDQQISYYALTRLVRTYLPFILDGFAAEDEKRYVPIKVTSTAKTNQQPDVTETSSKQEQESVMTLAEYLCKRKSNEFESMDLDEFNRLTVEVAKNHTLALLEKSDGTALEEFLSKILKKLPLDKAGQSEYSDFYNEHKDQIQSLYS
ncbi:recombinase RecT [Photobacterium leiognathi]|uniref:recombinase RecT n=1 Tax=Photobacterium leiognathi TaxID=553611 RepID=UPI002981F8D3|nr:recombinase RecT [Photobacterium leiognathi]